MRIDRIETAPSYNGIKPLSDTAQKEAGLDYGSDDFIRTSSTPSQSLSYMGNAGKIMDARGLDKRGMDYRLENYTYGQDGTAYVSYSSHAQGTAQGYIAARSPQGVILWETPVDEGGSDILKAGNDGILYGQTEKHLKAYNADGTVKFDHVFEVPVREHIMDSSGNHYFVQQDSRELYMIDSGGARRELPDPMKGIKGSEVVQLSADELMLRDEKHFCRINLKEGRVEEEFLFNDTAAKESNITRSVHHFEVPGTGEVNAWINNSKYVPGRSYNDDFHIGLGFGRRWGGMPHPPMDDSFYSGTTINELSLERLDAKGSITWSTGPLGSGLKTSQLNDGTVIYTGNDAEIVPNPNYIENPPPGTPYIPREMSSGRYFVGTVSPEGVKTERAFAVEGEVSGLYASRDTGNCLICHGNDRISECDGQGRLVAEKTVPDTGAVLTPKGLAGPHGVLLNDKEGRNAYSFDMETGTLTKLTESEEDYSFMVAAKEMEQQEAEAPADDWQSLEDCDGFISIGGIKLPKK